MSTPIPPLTPTFCFNETALRDFLRLSRSSLDDTISQHVSSLPVQQAQAPTSSSPRRPTTRPTPDPTSCGTFLAATLFPTWHARSTLLTYCGAVAARAPDPEDPDTVLRETEDLAARERVVNERLDPYSARYFPREGREERLAGLVRSELGVEEVVRRRTWEVVKERCVAAGLEGEWREGMRRWEQGIEDKR